MGEKSEGFFSLRFIKAAKQPLKEQSLSRERVGFWEWLSDQSGKERLKLRSMFGTRKM